MPTFKLRSEFLIEFLDHFNWVKMDGGERNTPPLKSSSQKTLVGVQNVQKHHNKKLCRGSFWHTTRAYNFASGRGRFHYQRNRQEILIPAYRSRPRQPDPQSGKSLVDMCKEDHRDYNQHLLNVHQALKSGVNVNQKDKNSDSPLIWATYNGRTAIVFSLVKYNADVNQRGEGGSTALQWAAYLGHMEIVRFLLRPGRGYTKANVADRDILGRNALMMAAGQGHSDIVDILLAEKEADVNVKDGDGKTAQMLAIEYGHVQIASRLHEIRIKSQGKSV